MQKLLLLKVDVKQRQRKKSVRCAWKKKRDESIDFALCSFAHVENAVNVATREEKNTRTGATTTGKNKEKKIVSKLLFNLKIRKLRRVLHNNCVGTFVCICAQQRWMQLQLLYQFVCYSENLIILILFYKRLLCAKWVALAFGRMWDVSSSSFSFSRVHSVFFPLIFENV